MKTYYDLTIPEILYQDLTCSELIQEEVWDGKEFVNTTKENCKKVISEEASKRINDKLAEETKEMEKKSISRFIDYDIFSLPYFNNAWIKAFKLTYDLVFYPNTYDETIIEDKAKNVKRKKVNIPQYANGCMWEEEIFNPKGNIAIKDGGKINFINKKGRDIILRFGVVFNTNGDDEKIFVLTKLSKQKGKVKDLSYRDEDIISCMFDGFIHKEIQPVWNYKKKKREPFDFSKFEKQRYEDVIKEETEWINPDEGRLLFNDDIDYQEEYTRKSITIKELEEIIKKELTQASEKPLMI